jgi:hypothetical protein
VACSVARIALRAVVATTLIGEEVTLSLQPYFTFQDEATRLNELYWSCRYSMRCLARSERSTVSMTTEPTADEEKNRRHPLPQAALRRGLRVAAVLHVCSAFEHALGAYFALCILYRPGACGETGRFEPLPLAVRNAGDFEAARHQARTTTDTRMHGSYTSRLDLFSTKFGIDVSWRDPTVNAHQTMRHKVAHDQGLDGADDPALSSLDVIARRTTVTEREWKTMLGVFTKTIDRLDDAVANSVVTDHGLILAVHRTLARTPSAKYEDVIRAIHREWRIPASHRSKADVLYNLGLVEQGLGRKSAARSYLSQSLKLAERADVRAALRQL